MDKFLNLLRTKDSDWKVKAINKNLKDGERILDFGCGDMHFSKSLSEKKQNLIITGVDVVNFANRPKNFKFVTYNGLKLPFKDNSFDAVIAIYVYHHSNNPEVCFKECYRVARKKVIFIESVYHHKIEIPFMNFMDWIFNVWKPEHVPLTYKFYSYRQWMNILKKNKVKKIKVEKLNKPYFSILPSGTEYLFVVSKSN